MQKKAMTYKSESIGAIMATNVPICKVTDDVNDVIENLTNNRFKSIHYIYVVDEKNKLIGLIDVTKLVREDNKERVEDIYQKPRAVLTPHLDQEQAVYCAVKDDIVAIPVVDKNNKFLGAVTSHAIIDVMHDEHIEDALLTAGIRSNESTNLSTLLSRTSVLVKARAPWLVIGLLAGLMLGYISSWFEEALMESIAIAYFIPVIAYVAGSVGSQAGAIAVRAISLMKIDYKRYLFKEFLTGVFLGLIVGVVGFIGSFVIAQDITVSIVVALALALASVIASVLASLIPFMFKKFGKDPALGSGPIATALLDVVSVLCYFLIAVALL